MGPTLKRSNVDEAPTEDLYPVDAALEDEGSADGTGSTPSTVVRRSDIANQELKFRFIRTTIRKIDHQIIIIQLKVHGSRDQCVQTAR